MTTIVYRNRVLAADRRAYAGDKMPIGSKTKIHRLPDGTLLGVSSSKVGVPDMLRRTVEEKGVRATFAEGFDANAIAISEDGSIWFYAGERSFSGPIAAEYLAIGSGDHFALGALAMGADARRAVEVAISLDVWSGEGVDTIALDEG